MTNLLNPFLASGLSPEIIYILLVLPFVTLFVSFARYLLGIKTLSIFNPIIISFALFAISPNFWTGLKVGLPILLASWMLNEILRASVNKMRLHYISRISFKISLISLLMIFVIYFLGLFDPSIPAAVNPLGIIVFLSIVETITLFYTKKGEVQTNTMTIETIIVAFSSYFLISLPWLKALILDYPYVVLLPIMSNFIVGRWTGLRISELFRFKEVIKDE